jgi:hypothetical protein
MTCLMEGTFSRTSLHLEAISLVAATSATAEQSFAMNAHSLESCASYMGTRRRRGRSRRTRAPPTPRGCSRRCRRSPPLDAERREAAAQVVDELADLLRRSSTSTRRPPSSRTADLGRPRGGPVHPRAGALSGRRRAARGDLPAREPHHRERPDRVDRAVDQADQPGRGRRRGDARARSVGLDDGRARGPLARRSAGARRASGPDPPGSAHLPHPAPHDPGERQRHRRPAPRDDHRRPRALGAAAARRARAARAGAGRGQRAGRGRAHQRPRPRGCAARRRHRARAERARGSRRRAPPLARGGAARRQAGGADPRARLAARHERGARARPAGTGAPRARPQRRARPRRARRGRRARPGARAAVRGPRRRHAARSSARAEAAGRARCLSDGGRPWRGRSTRQAPPTIAWCSSRTGSTGSRRSIPRASPHACASGRAAPT